MSTYQIVIDESETVTADDGLYDVPTLTDTVNPFANYGVARFDDRDGELYDKLPRGTRVDFELAEGINPDPVDFNTRLYGFVVERREIENAGADQLEIEVYSLDQLIRGEKVSFDTSGMTVLETLEDLIINDTPIIWQASNVEVEDNYTLSRNLRGERVEDALLYLSFTSDNERILVNQELEFEFAPQESESAPRDIDQTQWFYTDIPEDGKEVVNECRVWFNDGSESVTVSNGDDKLNLQDSLGTDGPYTRLEEISRPDITNIEDAETEAERRLDERETATPIKVATYGLEEAYPGQVISVSIPQKGLDDEFQIAAVSYNWAADEVTLTLIENTGYQNDLLVRVVSSIERVELTGVDRDGLSNEVTDTTLAYDVDMQVGTANVSDAFEDWRFTNFGRNAMRDAWANQEALNITEIAAGTSEENLSRTNTALESESESLSATVTTSGIDTFTATATNFSGAVTEVGLFTDNGMLARAVIRDGSVSSPSEINFEITLSDATESDYGIITDTGIENMRDMMADNAPVFPTQYAYGDGTATLSPTATTLTNQLTSVSLDSVLLLSVDNLDEWQSAVTLLDTSPAKIEDGELQSSQTNFVANAVNTAIKEPYGTWLGMRTLDNSYDDGAGLSFLNEDDLLRFRPFELEYTLESGDIGVAARMFTEANTLDSNPVVSMDIRDFDTDELIATQTLYDGQVGLTGRWVGFGDGQLASSPSDGTWNGGDLEPGSYYYEVYVETEGTSGDPIIIDDFSFFDTRYDYDFDETLHENGGHLDGPELKPDVLEVELDEIQTNRPITVGSVTSVWDDTTGNQYIELSNDGNVWWATDNSQTASQTFSEAEIGLGIRLGIARYPTGVDAQDATPRYGYNSQKVDELQATANPDAITPDGLGSLNVRAIIPPGDLENETIIECGLLDSNSDLMTWSILPETTIGTNERVISAERVDMD